MFFVFIKNLSLISARKQKIIKITDVFINCIQIIFMLDHILLKLLHVIDSDNDLYSETTSFRHLCIR